MESTAAVKRSAIVVFPELFPPALPLRGRLLIVKNGLVAQAEKTSGAGSSRNRRELVCRRLTFSLGEPGPAEDRDPDIASPRRQQRYHRSRFGQGVVERAAAKGFNPVSLRQV